MIYRTWSQLRLYLERQGYHLPDNQWYLLQDLLGAAAVHPPFCDGDAEYACKQIRKLQAYNRNAQTLKPVIEAKRRAARARAESLTPTRRSEIARQGARARWGKV